MEMFNPVNLIWFTLLMISVVVNHRIGYRSYTPHHHRAHRQAADGPRHTTGYLCREQQSSKRR